ncbi:MAG TPA: STAS/SEC14 domain-containing protein [Candidatus Saccharimonadales bacterium]|nr:STAS/SEC14 domain-containing protein [Candidatus Saccharimonadales bacterium]
MARQTEKVQTFANPGGFVEQHYVGVQTPDDVISGIKELVKRAQQLKAKKQLVLILVDVTEVPKIDISGKMVKARSFAVEAMTSAKYDRIAVYGNVAVQIMVNTLALIAGKRQKVRVFTDRTEALKWLKREE